MAMQGAQVQTVTAWKSLPTFVRVAVWIWAWSVVLGVVATVVWGVIFALAALVALA